MKPEILERQIAHAGYVTVERFRMRLTDGAEVTREVERHGDAAAVLPYDVERRSALVVRLFRAAKPVPGTPWGAVCQAYARSKCGTLARNQKRE